MSKPFASRADTKEQIPQVVELAKDVYGYLSAFDPNTGFIVSDDCCLVIDTRATPSLGRQFLADIRKITDKPVKYVFLTHYHAVRVFGAPAFSDATIITSAGTRHLIATRGEADFKSEVERFPRLFKGVDEIKGLTWPHVTFDTKASLWFGDREICFEWLGRSHTSGDSICYLPKDGIVFTGDMVDYNSASYTGDAYIRDWIKTLERLRALDFQVLIPGRGAAAHGKAEVHSAIDQTTQFLQLLISTVEKVASKSDDLRLIYNETYDVMSARYKGWPIFEHAIPFNVSRAFDEIRGVVEPRIWTAERDRELWDTLFPK